ncbi:MAG: hypothetical protein RMK18_04855 [Armatimonadota bacterium]|nr:hypothetical protein [Armatimonadota bacterium]MDW8025181.1 hypothetical protein [Armatimonadota bacterium]
MRARRVMPVTLIALPLVACLIAVCLRASTAQPPQQDQPQIRQQVQQPGAFQRGEQQQREGPRGFDRGAFQRMMFRAALPVAIYANEKYVYVVRGNVLYQFDAETLQLKNRVILEDIVPPGAEAFRERGR